MSENKFVTQAREYVDAVGSVEALTMGALIFREAIQQAVEEGALNQDHLTSKGLTHFFEKIVTGMNGIDSILESMGIPPTPVH
jgi:hypothetical protein